MELRMSRKERDRLTIIKPLAEGRLTQVAAGRLLGLSARQVRRILARYRAEGDAGLVHGSLLPVFRDTPLSDPGELLPTGHADAIGSAGFPRGWIALLEYLQPDLLAFSHPRFGDDRHDPGMVYESTVLLLPFQHAQ